MATPSAFPLSGGGGDGSYQLIETKVANNDANIDFTDLSSDYSSYVVEGYGIYAVAAPGAVQLRGSTDNGATFISTNTYQYALTLTPMTGGAGFDAGSNSSSSIAIISNLRTTSSDGNTIKVQIYNPSSSTYIKRVATVANQIDNPGVNYSMIGGGIIDTTDPINAIRFFGGTNLFGTFKLYGIKA